MNKFLVVLSILVLTGCTNIQNSYQSIYIGPAYNQNDLFIVSAKDNPVIVSTDYTFDYLFPLLRNTEIITTWYNDSKPMIMINEDNTIYTQSSSGVYSGNYQWMSTNMLVVEYTELNSQQLAEPFYQFLYFTNLDNCAYTVDIITFDVTLKTLVNKCTGDGA